MRPRRVRALRLIVLLVSTAALASLTHVPPVEATVTSSFVAEADSYVAASKPTKNFGTANLLRANARPTMITYLRFRVEGLTEPVISATLSLFSHGASTAGFDVHHVVDDSWSETLLTFANAPPVGDSVASSGAYAGPAWVLADVSSAVQGNGVLSLAVTTSESAQLTFSSRETRGNGPLLSVVTGTRDTTAPTVPTGLTATAVGSGQVDLAWTASSDDRGVTAYTVYRDGGPVATVSGGTTSYSDTSVSPSTTYAYQVDAVDAAGNRSALSDPASVTTPASADPVVGVVGNMACDPNDPDYNFGNGSATLCRQRYTSDLAAGMNLDAVFALGDMQYDCGGYSAFQQVYDPTWGRVKAVTRPAPGSHELYNTADSPNGTDCSSTRNASGYFRYFGAAAGDPTKGYYSYNLGSWHVIVLNSNCWRVGGCGPGSVQEQWLRADLAASQAQCTVAYWHHPRFSSRANNDTVDGFWRALYQAGAEVVLVAHHHFYERFAPQDPDQRPDPEGIRQFIVGTGGRSFSTFNTIQPNSEVRQNNTFGILTMTLHPTSYDWRFVSEAGRTFTDSGSHPCH